MLEKRHQANPDQEYLQPINYGKFVIGYVDEIHGDGSKEIEGFVTTQYELTQLVKFWAKQILEIRWFYFWYTTIGSWEIRMEPYALRRIDRIADLVGTEQVDKAINEIYAEFKNEYKEILEQNSKTLGFDVWETFKNHNKDQMEKARKLLLSALNESGKKDKR